MMRFNTFLIAVAAFAFGISTATAAEPGGYIGAGAGFGNYDYDDVDDSGGFKIYGGYRLEDGTFGIEAAYLDLGDADITSVPGLSFNIYGLNVSATLNGTVGAGSPVNLFGNLGFYSFDTELKGPGGSTTESSGGLSFGLGLEYAASDQLGIRGEIQIFSEVEDFAADEDVTFMSVALTYGL